MSNTYKQASCESEKVFASLAAAAAVSSALACLYIGIVGGSLFAMGLWPHAFMIAFIYSLFGLPAFYIARQKNWFTWRFSMISGFVAGVFPYAFFVLPSGMFFADIKYLLYGGGLGLLGMAGGMAALAVWRGLSRD